MNLKNHFHTPTMSGRRRSLSPRNKRHAPRSYGDFGRNDRSDRGDRDDRSDDRRDDYRRGREGYRERDRYRESDLYRGDERDSRLRRPGDHGRNERLTDDFGRDIPRDSFKADKRVERNERVERAEQVPQHKVEDKVEEKVEEKVDQKTEKPATIGAETASKSKNKKKAQEPEEAANDSDEELQRMMGLSSASFGTTKHKKVAGNQVGAVSKPKATQYRQYMNRVGGFNRALSPERKK